MLEISKGRSQHLLNLHVPRGTSWLRHGDFPNHADEGMQCAKIWFDRSCNRIATIFSSCPRQNPWWAELKHKVYNWLTLKHNVLSFAGMAASVAASDIADQIVSHTRRWVSVRADLCPEH